MTSYYGGRCECRIRKKPVKVTVLDFFSMYPTITLLLGLWNYVIADKIQYEEIIDTKDTLSDKSISIQDTLNTENELNSIKPIQEIIDSYDIAKALDADLWKSLNLLIEIEPDSDILPIRSKYSEKDSSNIGINYVNYKGSLYYFFPDILASKLLTGKSSKVKSAIRFTPEGIQEDLTETEIYGVHVNPKKDNLIKLLVERRQEIKQDMKRVAKDSHEYDVLDAQQRALKILNNSTTYGIYIEMHPKEKEKLDVFSTEEFETEGTFESTSTFFNPIIGANITAGARLLLAIAESFVKDKGEVHAYMDTDSIFVPPHIANELSHLFDSLNPYDFDKPILEIEEGMEDIWFYGISSKRYCLFRIVENKIIIPEGKKLFYKLHGLGHITNPFSREQKDGDKWHKRLWEDILRVHFHPEDLPDVLEKYENYAVISKLAVSTGTILRWFKKMNEGKDFDKQIKPFNLMLVGNGAKVNDDGEEVKPIAPFNKNPQVAVEKPFINKYTGDILQGREYWKPLSDVFLEYIDHPEAKFEGDTGILQRRHLKPKGCVYIGKEANKVEMQELEVNRVETYYDIGKLREYILDLTPAEAREIGIKHRSTLKKIKDRVREGEFNMDTKEIRKVLNNVI